MSAFKKLFIIFVATVTVVAGYFIYTTGSKNSEISYAKKEIEAQTKNYIDENKQLKEQKNAYYKTINDYEKKEVADDEKEKIEDYENQINDYTSKTNTMEAQLSSAKAKLEAISKYNVNSQNISNDTTGEAKTLAEGTYACPSDDLHAGRYKLSGTGSFRIVNNTSNTVEDSQNLKNLDTNSYTLNITENTRLITEGEVSIVPVR